MSIHETFGTRVKASRTARGWKLRDLAAKAGIAISTCNRIEFGHGVTLEKAAAIAEAFGVPLSTMIEPAACAKCADCPPPGFTCQACGAEGPEVAP